MKNEQGQPNPNPLTDPLLPVIQGQTLITAVMLRIIETIGRKGGSLEEITGKLNLNRQGLQKMMSMLATMGYQAHSGGAPGCRTDYRMAC